MDQRPSKGDGGFFLRAIGASSREESGEGRQLTLRSKSESCILTQQKARWNGPDLQDTAGGRPRTISAILVAAEAGSSCSQTRITNQPAPARRASVSASRC